MTTVGVFGRVMRHRVAAPLLEALTAQHGPDRYLQMVSPLWSLRQGRAQLVEVRRGACGSGSTPAASVLPTACPEGDCAETGAGRVTFLRYARSEESLVYADELEQFAQRNRSLRLLRSYTRVGGGELSGRFEPAHLPPLDQPSAAWVCGPAGLVDAVRTHWEREAIRAPLQTEQFTAPAPVVPAED